MNLWSNSFNQGDYIPGEFAFAVIDPVSHVALSNNRNPHLGWDEVPDGTKSFALICHDIDVPSRGDDVNQEGKTVPADLPRVDFFHWVLVDLPPRVRAIEVGQFSDGVTPHGKPGPQVPDHPGVRQGLNDYTNWFAGDKQMEGNYFGYDGPCPPWNDARIHRYAFTLYALDIERVPVDGNFTGMQVRDAIRNHILAEADIVGRYTLNPALAENATGASS